MPKGTLYTDNRVLYLEYIPTTYPYTVEFISEVQTPNTGGIPSCYFLDGYNVSTEESRYILEYNKIFFIPASKRNTWKNTVFKEKKR